MTSKTKYELDVELRNVQGKGASRRLRRESSQVPGILYGGGEEPTLISLNHLKVLHALENPGFYSHIINLKMDGKKHQVILKDLQRHHYKKAVLHMDFLRVKPTDIIQMKIPIHFSGAAEAPGVKNDGGIVHHHMSELEVRCQVQNLPEVIEIDLSNMVLDQIIHISELKLPKGAEPTAFAHGRDKEHDHAVVSIHLPKVVEEETPAPAAEGEEAEGAEGTTAEAAGTPAGKAGAEAPKGSKDSKESPKGTGDKGKGGASK